MLIQADSRPVEQTLISLENLVQCGKRGNGRMGGKESEKEKREGKKREGG